MHGSWMGRLFLCGEHLRGSESGNLERFTVSLSPSHSFWGFVLFLVLLFVFGLWVLVLFCVFGFVSPTMLRSSSCLPELTTVRAVMVHAAMEKKKTANVANSR